MAKDKVIGIEELIQDDHNFNKGTEKGKELIEKSFRELGAGRSVLIDKDNRMMPFFGKYYFAYIPEKDGRILGISKIARVVGYCAAKLQLQERLAHDVVNMLTEALDGKVQGMAIVMRGQHLCKTMRGVKNKGKMTVSHLSGIFKDDASARAEFYKLIDQQNEF